MSKTYRASIDGTSLLRGFSGEPYLFLLESRLNNEDNGRYSYLGFDPFLVVENSGPESLQKARASFKRFRVASEDRSFAANGGIVGLVSYDFGLCREKIPLRQKKAAGIPDCCFGFYDTVITIDHLGGMIHVTSTGLPEPPGNRRQARASERLRSVCRRLEEILNGEACHPKEARNVQEEVPCKSNFTKKQYLDAVKRAKDHIARGDIYQVNLSQQFVFDFGTEACPPERIYDILSESSPTNFSGFFRANRFSVVSNSPERFLSLKGNRLQARPMKGTAPRGGTLEEDRAFADSLENSVKDRAELLMITDLLRNDLGRVCRYGSVSVRALRTIEKYETVYQTTSTVEGTLEEGKDAFDAVHACFPGGSVTGCPKIRSMEIIEELEPDRRGAYTGSLGYISFAGDMDFNILIRTLFQDKNRTTFHVGGGIVADSRPEMEYDETLLKAKAMRTALSRVLAGSTQTLTA